MDKDGSASNEEENDNGDDESYLADSGTSDTERSVDYDVEVGGFAEENGSDHEEDELGLEYDNEPPKQVRGLANRWERSGNKPFFMLGMTFVDKGELKRALDRCDIIKGVNLRVLRSDKSLLRAVCDEGCPFLLYASTDGLNIGFKIKTLLDEHSCARVYKNLRASIKWLADYFKDKVQELPKFMVTEMKEEVERDLKVHVSLHKCKRAKRKIIQEMEGSFKDEFSKLEV